jgi:oligosaccharide repeat unit polymerase
MSVLVQSPTNMQLVARTLILNRLGLWFLLAASLVLFVWASIQIARFDSATVTNTFAVSLAALLWLVIYVVSTTSAFGTPYLLTTAYILALVVFHFGLIAQDGFGIVSVADYRGNFGRWITLGGFYTNLALACLGFAFAATCIVSSPSPPISREAATRLVAHNLTRLHGLGIGLCFASLVFLAIGIMQVGNILSYDRVTLFYGGMDIRGIGVFNWVAPSAAVALVISSQTRRQKRWSYCIGLVTFGLFLLSGNRSMAYFPLLVGVVLWVKSGRKIPILMATGLAVLALAMIPVLGALRTERAYENISLDAIVDSSAGVNVGTGLAEMGGSAGILAITLQAIPAEEPYRLGTSYLGYLRNMIPNVGLHYDLSKDSREIIHRNGSLEEGLLRVSPSTWASVKVLGIDETLYQHSGVGFSAVAEPYFNFGYLGVVGFFVLMGFFLARMECSHLLLHYSWLVFSSIFYWLLILTVRNEFGNFTKPASYILSSIAVWLLARRFLPFSRP